MLLSVQTHLTHTHPHNSQNRDENFQVHRSYLCGDQNTPRGGLGRHWRSDVMVTETGRERSEEHLELEHLCSRETTESTSQPCTRERNLSCPQHALHSEPTQETRNQPCSAGLGRANGMACCLPFSRTTEASLAQRDGFSKKGLGHQRAVSYLFQESFIESAFLLWKRLCLEGATPRSHCPPLGPPNLQQHCWGRLVGGSRWCSFSGGASSGWSGEMGEAPAWGWN